MEILVTGGAGFVGSHLTEELLRRGRSVRVLDDLSTGSLENLSAVRAHPRLKVTEGSVLDEGLVSSLVRGSCAVFHLAAAVGVKLVAADPLAAMRVNVRGAEIVLDAAAAAGRRCLLASTSEVYGASTRLPFSEDQPLVLPPPSQPRGSYACAKALGEARALAHAGQSGLAVTVLRLFNTVGPRQVGRYGMVIPTFVEQALSGRPLTVFGDGTQTRCFAAVSEVCAALADALDCPAARGEVINLGSAEETSILALARLVKDVTGSSSPVSLVPFAQARERAEGEPARRVPDLSKAARLLGYRHRSTLESIVRGVADSIGAALAR